MGIRGLQTYIEGNNRGFITRDIKTLVNEFKESRRLESRPVLVIDTPNILRPIFQDFDWICGGQYEDYKQRLIALVTLLEGYGLDLVFFSSGIETAERRLQWFERRKDIADKFHTIVNCVEREQDLPEMEIIQPGPVYFFAHYILKFVCKCEVKVPTMEKSEAIARYAKTKTDCFAILSADSIYTIYNAAPYIMSIKNVNWSDSRNLRPLIFRSTILAEVGPHPSFSFDPKWLPVVGALLENDSITKLTALYKGLNRIPRFFPIREVMPFVENTAGELSNSGCELEDATGLIIQMYGKYNQIRSHQNQLRQSLNKSIKSYALANPRSNELVPDSESLDKFLKQVLEFPVVITSMLDVVINRECEYTNLGEKTRGRNTRIPSSWDLFMNLNKYYYGILLNDARNEGFHFKVKEYSEHTSTSLENPQFCKPEFPPLVHPGETIQWLHKSSGEENDVITLILWALGKESLSENSEIVEELDSKLNSIGDKYLVPSLVLFYLGSKPEMKPYMGYYIRMIVKLDQGERTEEKQLCRNASELGLQLTAIYHRGLIMLVRVVSLFKNCFSSNIFDISNYFDGILFHKICREDVGVDGGSDLRGELVVKIRDLVSFKPLV